MSPDTLPSFDRPPVVETVLGVQFDPIPNLSNAHMGAFSRSIRKDWPKVSDAPKLELVKEQFGAEQTWGRFVVSTDRSSRLQVRNDREDLMIQVQNGRLHFNWLGRQNGKTPGVQRQWCGERGKIESCVVGQHLLYTDNHPTNPYFR